MDYPIQSFSLDHGYSRSYYSLLYSRLWSALETYLFTGERAASTIGYCPNATSWSPTILILWALLCLPSFFPFLFPSGSLRDSDETPRNFIDLALIIAFSNNLTCCGSTFPGIFSDQAVYRPTRSKSPISISSSSASDVLFSLTLFSWGSSWVWIYLLRSIS